jgi:hypothetical protein
VIVAATDFNFSYLSNSTEIGLLAEGSSWLRPGSPPTGSAGASDAEADSRSMSPALTTLSRPPPPG